MWPCTKFRTKHQNKSKNFLFRIKQFILNIHLFFFLSFSPHFAALPFSIFVGEFNYKWAAKDALKTIANESLTLGEIKEGRGGGISNSVKASARKSFAKQGKRWVSVLCY